MHFTSAKSPPHLELLFGVLVAEQDARRTLVGVAAADAVNFWSHISNISTVLGAFVTLRKSTVSFAVSVRLFAWNNSASTGRIFMKFDI
jgi:hypothetical protein